MEAEQTEQQRVDDFEAVREAMWCSRMCGGLNAEADAPCDCGREAALAALTRIKARAVQLVLERDAEHARYLEAHTRAETLRSDLRRLQQAHHEQHATLQAREEEIRTWREASGLEVDGSTDAVTPEHLLEEFKRRDLTLAEAEKKRAEALASLAQVPRLAGRYVSPEEGGMDVPGLLATMEQSGAALAIGRPEGSTFGPFAVIVTRGEPETGEVLAAVEMVQARWETGGVRQ